MKISGSKWLLKAKSTKKVVEKDSGYKLRISFNVKPRIFIIKKEKRAERLKRTWTLDQLDSLYPSEYEYKQLQSLERDLEAWSYQLLRNEISTMQYVIEKIWKEFKQKKHD
jgi:hypothetical protein